MGSLLHSGGRVYWEGKHIRALIFCFFFFFSFFFFTKVKKMFECLPFGWIIEKVEMN